MKELEDINFLEDERLQSRLVALSLAIAGAGVLLGVPLCLFGVLDFPAEFSLIDGKGAPGVLTWALALVAVSLVALPAHELVHAAAFRVFGGPGTHVSFGFSQGMLFAGCPGLVLLRLQFVAVLAAPAVVLSVLLLGIPALLGLPALGFVAFVLHLSGCSGDLLAVCAILRKQGCTHCEDTSTGVRLLG